MNIYNTKLKDLTISVLLRNLKFLLKELQFYNNAIEKFAEHGINLLQ